MTIVFLSVENLNLPHLQTDCLLIFVGVQYCHKIDISGILYEVLLFNLKLIPLA
jgi:hypothetical protein